MSIIIESLQSGKHVRANFSCGEAALDTFLQEYAQQAIAKNLSKTYVAVDPSNEAEILGYYTVTPTRLEAGEMPAQVVKGYRLPKTGTLPASLVARLAVVERKQHDGIGQLMIFDALARCARVSREIGGVAIVVDALEERLVGYYQQFGFERFEEGSLKMFMLMDTARAILGDLAIPGISELAG